METMSNTDLCYKSCGDYIVTMKKLPDTVTNESRKDVVDPLYSKFRADKLLVVRIEHKNTDETVTHVQNTTYRKKKIWYEVSKEVSVTDYNQDLDEVCAPGIHYFLSRDAAFYWNNAGIINGLRRTWYGDGQKKLVSNYADAKLNGPCQSWYVTGQKRKECSYVSGKLHGPHQSWHINGQKKRDCTYLDGVLDGLWQRWYKNGQKLEECTYIDGVLHGSHKFWYENGQTRKVYTYIDGILHGLWQRLYDDDQDKYE